MSASSRSAGIAQASTRYFGSSRRESCPDPAFHVSSSNRPGTKNSSCMTVEIEHVLLAEDVREVIETAEQAGSVRASELTELVERHEMNEHEAEALYREWEQRGDDVVADKEEQTPTQQRLE